MKNNTPIISIAIFIGGILIGMTSDYYFHSYRYGKKIEKIYEDIIKIEKDADDEFYYEDLEKQASPNLKKKTTTKNIITHKKNKK